MSSYSGENSVILKALQQPGVVAHNEDQASGDFLPVSVPLDVRTGNLAKKRRLGGARRGSRLTRTAVTVF